MRLTIALVFVLLVCCAVGCKPRRAGVAQFNKTNMDRLRNAYTLYLAAHSYKGPADEKTLKQFLREDKAAGVRLGRMGITPDMIDDIFINERDGKPFRVRYGVSGLADHAIVFEEEGVNGKRYVGLTNPKEVDADEYERYWTGKIRPEGPGGLLDEPEPADASE